MVNCPGDSINDALETPAGDLVVEINGPCVEDAVVRRDRVTLKGANDDPLLDSIEAATTDPADDPRGCALLVRDARLVFLENLTLRGGVFCGLRVLNTGPGFEIRAVNLILEDNGVRGLDVVDARIRVIDTAITELAASGIRVDHGGFVRCNNCTVDVTGTALRVERSSSARVFDSALTGNGGVRVRRSSTVQLEDTTVTDTGGQALTSSINSAIFMRRGTLDGRIRVDDKSEVSLEGVEQIGGGGGRNSVQDDSFLTANRESARRRSSSIATSLLETTFFNFGRGTIANGSSVTDLSCRSGADVFCDFSSPVDPSSCALCPVAVCGNGIQEPGESCDDGGTVPGDGCSALCAIEGAAVCGNGVLQGGEECDDGNAVGGDGCSATCTDEICGNGVIDLLLEECDDGNLVSGDGCNDACFDEFCGDGFLQAARGEQCDDGNFFNGDSCSAFCTIN